MILRRIRYLLLFGCVVLAQHATVLHAIAHLGQPGSTRTEISKPAVPSAQYCEQCLAFHGVGSALTGVHGAAPFEAMPASLVSDFTEEFLPRSGAPFSPRAPPFTSL